MPLPLHPGLLLCSALLLSPVHAQVPALPPSPVSPVQAIRRAALPLNENSQTYTPLLNMARNRSVVLIGESTHGTHEFYRTRAEITRRLLAEQGFDAVIIEGDWPDAQRVNRFVRGEGTDATPEEALANFERFPEWMWRNTVVRDFVGWLREHNRTQPRANQAGFYGMDLYSAVQSRQEVMRLLGALNPGGLGKVRDRYNCLNRLAPEVDSGMPMPLEGDGNACEQGVTAVLTELQQYRTAQRGRTGVSAEALFDLEQNARVVRNALTYERVSLDPFGGSSSWNVRDGHMFETLEAIRSHLGPQARVVVWAHNSHLGDASATEIGRGGELNLGQLVRQKYGMAALLVGFTTHTGTVTAARNWDRPGEKRAVRPSLVGSYERLFHDTGLSSFLLFPSRLPAAAWGDERLERAIGVVYAPETERESHYFLANLPRQFDAVIHFDVTRALEPLPQR